MKVNTSGKDFIKKQEGKILTVYEDDAKNLTVGYGHKVVASDHLKLGDTITQSKCDSLFASDIAYVEKKINTHPKVSKMTQAMYNATASLLFNVGTKPITSTSNDLYKILNMDATYHSPMPIACQDFVVKAFTYTLINGKRSDALVDRRNAELNIFLGTSGKIYIKKNS